MVIFWAVLLRKLWYNQLYRLIARASTHLLGTTPVGDYQTLFERLGPIESSNDGMAVLTK
jgi:hypothetical protein